MMACSIACCPVKRAGSPLADGSRRSPLSTGTVAATPATGGPICPLHRVRGARSEEHTSELQSLMRISYAVFCLKKKTIAIVLVVYNNIDYQHLGRLHT